MFSVGNLSVFTLKHPGIWGSQYWVWSFGLYQCHLYYLNKYFTFSFASAKGRRADASLPYWFHFFLQLILIYTSPIFIHHGFQMILLSRGIFPSQNSHADSVILSLLWHLESKQQSSETQRPIIFRKNFKEP